MQRPPHLPRSLELLIQLLRPPHRILKQDLGQHIAIPLRTDRALDIDEQNRSSRPTFRARFDAAKRELVNPRDFTGPRRSSSLCSDLRGIGAEDLLPQTWGDLDFAVR